MPYKVIGQHLGTILTLENDLIFLTLVGAVWNIVSWLC